MKVMHTQEDDKPRLYPDLSGIEDRQEEYCEPTPQYPLVEVANPHYDPRQPLAPDNNRMMRVYRPLTESDLQEACKGVGKPTEGTERNDHIYRETNTTCKITAKSTRRSAAPKERSHL